MPFALAVAGIAACSQGEATAPVVQVQPEKANRTVTTLGSSTITMSGDNANPSGGLPWGWVDLGGRANSSTGITIPPNTTFRIIVSGRVTANPKNPAPACAPPSETYYWQGSYGPVGTGNAGSELAVYLQFRETGGANTQINFFQGQTGRSAPDTARSDYFYTSAGGVLWAGHAGMYLTCGETVNGVTTVRGMYSLSGTRNITVESETNALKLTASPSYIRAGTPVTFTYSRADGSTNGSMPMWRRAWIKDPGVTAAGPSCGWEVNPCTSPVYGSGRMEVDIGINNKVYTASAHVTVYSSFVLDADRQVVAPGENVTFTPKLDGQATPAARWKWIPSASSSVNTSPCPSGVSTCTRKVMNSGTMWAYLESTPGSGDSANVAITVDTTTGGAGGGAAVKTCPAGALCSHAKLTVIRSDGVGGTQIPANGSTYPVGTAVPYSFAPEAGYREIALVVDDTGRAESATITMDRDHTIEVDADSNYLLNPDIAAIGTRLYNMVHASNAPAAYRDFLRWYDTEASARGTGALDRAIGVAQYVTFALPADTAALGAFDRAMEGVVIDIMNHGVDSDFEYSTPAQYRPGVVTNRRPVGGATLSSALFQTPTVVYVNGIATLPEQANVTAKSIRSLIRTTSISTNVNVKAFYNPTYSEEQKAWAQGYMCAGKAEADNAFTKALITAKHYATCKGVAMGKWLNDHDVPEAAAQLALIKYRFGTAVPQVVLDLGYYTALQHSSYNPTIFVTHSQGNLVFQQMLATLNNFENPQSQCIADLSLASPTGRSHFQLPSRFLIGATIHYDLLQLLVPYTDNDFTPFRETSTSLAAAAAFQGLSGPALLSAQVSWGKAIHAVNAQYLAHPDTRPFTVSSIENLYSECTTWP